MKLTPAQLDRACGVLLATAAGDALGAGYEFGPSLPDDTVIDMAGGGPFGWKPGEWTDDTAMAIAIAETAATGADLRTKTAQDQVVSRWEEWAATASDVGSQTRHVLSRVAGGGAAAAAAASAGLHRRTGKTAGNGALMRTAPVALAYLDDDRDGLAEAARSLSGLTHFDPEAGDACVLWCMAIRHAVLTGEPDVRAGLPYLPDDRRAAWSRRLEAAERSRPADFTRNGWVVEALQAAWSAIITTPVPAEDPVAGTFRADHLRLSLEHAVRGGHDTDTVAAIAGGLLGARWGASAVPAGWRLRLNGWPASKAHDLIGLACAIARAGTWQSSQLAHPSLAAVWRAGSMGRRQVRRFLGRWLDGQLITGPDAELRAALVEQLARQGWQIRPEDSVLVAAEPVRGIPVSAPFLREARLHPLIEAEARPQFMIRKLDQAVFASLRAVEIRVRALGGYSDQMIGADLMNRAFGPGGPLTDSAAARGEQEGTRALFAGAFGALRNPPGHRQVDYDDMSEAAETVQLASLLMRILDRVQARLVAAGRTAQATGSSSGTP